MGERGDGAPKQNIETPSLLSSRKQMPLSNPRNGLFRLTSLLMFVTRLTNRQSLIRSRSNRLARRVNPSP